MTYRLYPTPSQQSRLFHYLYVGRTLYNHALEQRIACYKDKDSKSLSFIDQTMDLTHLRAVSQVLADIPVSIERDALDRLDKAYSNFFRRVKEGKEKPGFPRFKSANRWNSFGISNPGKVIWHNTKIYVAGVGKINGRNVRAFVGKAKVLRIVLKAGKWYAKVVVDDGQEPPALQSVKSAIGIDVGLSAFATLDTGEKVENPRFYRNMERRLAKANRNVSRKVKGSRNRRKAVVRLQQVHAKIQDQRSNFTHHLSKRLIAEHQLIAVEDLIIKGMVRNKRLSKSILDAAWGQFIFQLSYKAEEAGCLLLKVNPRGTSQECSKCGQTVQKDLSVRVHSCPHCDLVLDRDVNAAKNILQRALRDRSAPGPGRGIGNACGGDVRPASVGGPLRSRKSLPCSIQG